ncbi:rod shape-determining protein MreC [Roseinatronobacter bogoriensis]|uniref:Cell shape-determining protein MreC n=1 Tax=Roseinatronobacter bogoriensis subsp. barguzinensis TaxID=441209 RepID=A0A2K8KHY6_9RHOB|nr:MULTISPECIES: rod shape-determining protein MreC [Rhodobaca]ATX66448.1 rod shape-determining protein MreC [Rhodobaca barguzinensis]MBB4207593.1 rod shape-determining protein MreC [Rhodobaca bogoriensis DSM 18756]TDW40100.1 rod shape-determining protein MreC [Rhodobaca barguzinensis]TDY70748.1 rod shape-determining protein MreC [Rhodobaca bogoriensis DSM 18756]
MAEDRKYDQDFIRPVRRILIGLLAGLMLLTFIIWRIDSPRVEQFRMAVIDRVVPSFDWAMRPVARGMALAENFRSYARIVEQNQELRRELQQMRAWREAALQLEQRNAQLLDLNQVRLDPQLTHVTGVVMADSGSPFRKSVLLNVGARDGVQDGWAVMDGLGLAGRIAGVGQRTSRVVLLTDTASAVPVVIQPSGQRAMLIGDNSAYPILEFIESPDDLRPGDRVISSDDGGVFPAGILVGEVVATSDRRLRVRISADYGRLEFLRVLRSRPVERILDTGDLIAPDLPDFTLPDVLDTPTQDDTADG